MDAARLDNEIVVMLKEQLKGALKFLKVYTVF